MASKQTPQTDVSEPVHDADGRADAIAATLIIALFVITMTFWLHGMQ
jgi:hypothetical protein